MDDFAKTLDYTHEQSEVLRELSVKLDILETNRAKAPRCDWPAYDAKKRHAVRLADFRMRQLDLCKVLKRDEVRAVLTTAPPPADAHAQYGANLLAWAEWMTENGGEQGCDRVSMLVNAIMDERRHSFRAAAE